MASAGQRVIIQLTKAGRVVADNDLWIASCAVRHKLPLISNNRKHFQAIPELTLISEAPVIAEIESQQSLLLQEEQGKQ
jgi:hypothetical protein